MHTKPNDVWITGVGLATALGTSYRELGDNLLAGRSGVVKVTTFDASQHPCQIGAQLAAIPCPPSWPASHFTKLTKQEQLILWCADSALRDADLWEQRTSLRVGVVFGMGAEWGQRWEADAWASGQELFRPQLDVPCMTEKLCRFLHLSGPTLNVSAACASGNYALAQARQWLRLGWVDICVAGACDVGVSPLGMGGFGNLRALSRRNDAPQQASRPFDKDRDGFVVGEGGVAFILERAEDASKRRARVYGCVAGYGASSDAFHMVIPSPHPEPASAAVRAGLADAQLNPADVHYVNAHATSTPVGDVAEARVLQAVFGAALPKIPVSSTKSMTGHLLTTAAALEAVACLTAIERKTVPPTINLDNPDPECPLCHVPHHAREHTVDVAISNSFGFGGSNTSLVLTRV